MVTLSKVVGVGINILDENSILNTDKKRIEQSFYMILSTPVGSRVHNMLFGSKLSLLIFEPLDRTTIGLATQYVKESLDTWERRAKVTSIEVNPSDLDRDTNTLPIHIHYIILGTNVEGSYVYPFKTSGMEL